MAYVKPPEIVPVYEEVEDKNHIPHKEVELTKSELRELATKVRNETAMVIGDIHFKYECKRSLELLLALMEDIQPDRVFLNGDILDFYALSSFDKDPKRADTRIMTEINKAKVMFEKMREICPLAKIYYICGNHELRLKKYLNRKAPDLHEVVNLPDLLELSKYDIKWIPGKKDAFVQYGETLIGHFNRVSKHSAYTAKALSTDMPGYNIVQSHVHRQGLYFFTIGDKQVWAAEGGCVADPRQADYIGGIPNWQRGGLVIETDEKGKQSPNLAQVVQNRLHFRGEIYE